MTEAKLFKALGDSFGLKIITKLSNGSTYTLGDITGGLGISRQAARKQVGVFVSAKIVRLSREGREVKVSLDIDSFESGKKFIEKLENQWDKRLLKLKGFLEKR